MSESFAYEKYNFTLSLSEKQLYIEICDDTTLNYYDCILDDSYIIHNKCIQNLEQLHKLIKTSLEGEDEYCQINEIKLLSDGLNINFVFDYVITFNFSILFKKVQGKLAQSIDKKELIRMSKTIREQQTIIEELQEKIRKVDLFDKIFSDMYVPIYFQTHILSFLRLYQKKLVIVYQHVSNGSSNMQSGICQEQFNITKYMVDECCKLRIIQCETLELCFCDNLYLPFLPRTFRKLILKDNADRESIKYDMFVDSCDNLEEIHFENFQTVINIVELFVKLVENKVMNPKKISIKIINSPVVMSCVPQLRQLGFTIIRD